ncbi:MULTISPECIES: hypothetical protein [unclassified Brevundimonas]|uniref:hypothetical protein n=1 Tax=unclassified Brevundimonas TaxID=2622653 RepID=UPI0025BBAFFF|nr:MULTISPECIES: hypothetical protein [unclassified Brevundimonas]
MAYTYFNRDAIQQEYLRRIGQSNDKRWGWSFMYVPEACLKRAKVMLIGLNPGGSEVDPAPEWDSPYDNAYVD